MERKYGNLILLTLLMTVVGCKGNDPLPPPSTPVVSVLPATVLGTSFQYPYRKSNLMVPDETTGGFFVVFDHVPYDMDPSTDEALRHSNVSLAACNVDGTVIWKKELKRGDYHQVNHAFRASNGDIVVSGEQVQVPQLGGISTPWGMRVSAAGEVIWEKNLTNREGTTLACAETPDQQLAFLVTDEDQYLLMTDPGGTEVQTESLKAFAWREEFPFQGLVWWENAGLLLYGESLVLLGENVSNAHWQITDTMYQALEFTDFVNVVPDAQGRCAALGKRTRNGGLTNTVILELDATGQKLGETIIDHFDVDLPVQIVAREDGGWTLMERGEEFGAGLPRASVVLTGFSRWGEEIWRKRVESHSLGFEWGICLLGLPDDRLMFLTIAAQAAPRGYERTLVPVSVIMP